MESRRRGGQSDVPVKFMWLKPRHMKSTPSNHLWRDHTWEISSSSSPFSQHLTEKVLTRLLRRCRPSRHRSHLSPKRKSEGESRWRVQASHGESPQVIPEFTRFCTAPKSNLVVNRQQKRETKYITRNKRCKPKLAHHTHRISLRGCPCMARCSRRGRM